MKKFGLPALLSVGYVCLLYFVFSSDFGKNHSFLMEETQTIENGRRISSKVSSDLPNLKSRITNYELAIRQASPFVVANDLQSAESALTGN